MRRVLIGAAMAAFVACSPALADVTYTFSAAPTGGWDAFSFSFTTPDILQAGEAFSFTAFTVTNGASSFLISQGASTTLAGQGNCFLFASAGETLVNGADTQCALGNPGAGNAAFWFFTGDEELPQANGTYADRYVQMYGDGIDSNDTGQDFAAVIAISGAAGAVPEPATWALMIAGFGMAGHALRRRRTAQASA